MGETRRGGKVREGADSSESVRGTFEGRLRYVKCDDVASRRVVDVNWEEGRGHRFEGNVRAL